MRKFLIGYVPVDSGQLLIADPCYLNKFTRDDYEDCVRITSKRDIPAAGMTFSKGLGKIDLGAVFSTPSDGRYPVYMFTDDEGNVVAVTIAMDEK